MLLVKHMKINLITILQMKSFTQIILKFSCRWRLGGECIKENSEKQREQIQKEDRRKSKDEAHKKYGNPKAHTEFDELKDEVDKEFDEPQYEVEEEGDDEQQQHEQTEGVQELPQDRGQAPSFRVITIYYSQES